MQWQKYFEPEALCLLGYMLLTYLYWLNGYVEIALVYALITTAHIKQINEKS
jgi:hypothetical protein